MTTFAIDKRYERPSAAVAVNARAVFCAGRIIGGCQRRRHRVRIRLVGVARWGGRWRRSQRWNLGICIRVRPWLTDGTVVVQISRAWLWKYLICVAFARLLVFSSSKLIRAPAFTLLGSGGWIDVPALTVFWLHGVFIVPVYLPVRCWVDVADQKCAVVVQRVWFASVVARDIVLFRVVGETDTGRPWIRAVAHVSFVVRPIGEPPEPLLRGGQIRMHPAFPAACVRAHARDQGRAARRGDEH
eukprot:6214105-Pleurochrysis_carterae.AAC.7